MTKPIDAASPDTLPALEALLDQKGPLLVEAAFPKMATASDWYLVDSIEEVRDLIHRLSGGPVLYFHPVWDLKNAAGSGIAVKS